MRTRLSRVILMLAIITSLSGAVPAALAAPPPYYVSFPWVPNGAMLGELGPFTGAVTIQNLEIVPITVTIYASVPGSVPINRAVDGDGSITISASEIGQPSRVAVRHGSPAA
jgi:hypothetical protein